jgi:predicted secreted Zn-dependent protease
MTPASSGLPPCARLALLLVGLAALVMAPVAGRASGGERPAVSTPEKGLTVRARYVYFTVQGRNAQELRADLERQLPVNSAGQRLDAWASWKVNWRYTYLETPRRCAVEAATVTVQLSFRLPRWQQPADVPPALVARWAHYVQALRLHADGHANNGVRTGRSILQRLRRLPPARTCKQLEKSANTIGAQETARGNAWDRAYDIRTRYGATQGAVFP